MIKFLLTPVSILCICFDAQNPVNIHIFQWLMAERYLLDHFMHFMNNTVNQSE